MNSSMLLYAVTPCGPSSLPQEHQEGEAGFAIMFPSMDGAHVKPFHFCKKSISPTALKEAGEVTEWGNFAFDLYSTVLSFVTDTAVFCCGLLQDCLITQTCVWFCCLYMMLISLGEDAFSNRSWSHWPRTKLSSLAEL